MWPKLVAEAKDGGADCIETYVFWNGHEIAPGQVRAPLPESSVVLQLFLLSEQCVVSICGEFRWVAVLLRGPVRPGAIR
jgi:hypothetical protein